jgi:hypothetical protein
MSALDALNARHKTWQDEYVKAALLSETLYHEGEAIGREAERMGFVFNEVTEAFEMP